MNCNLSNCKLTRKRFWDFNGIRTCGLYVSAAVLYQLSYEDPYIEQANLPSSSKPVKGMKHEDDVNFGNTNLNEGMIVAVVIVHIINPVVMGIQM